MRWLRIKRIENWIKDADSAELSEIVQAVLRCYNQLFTEEEFVFLSLPKHDQGERERIIQSFLSMEEYRE